MQGKQTAGTQQFGPYSPIRQAGSFYFVSGQVGVDPHTKLAEDNVSDQTRQALENMKRVVESAGLHMDKVVKTTVFLTDMNNFAAMNVVYETFFGIPRPARSAVAVKELPRVGGGVPLYAEIEAILYTDGKNNE